MKLLSNLVFVADSALSVATGGVVRVPDSSDDEGEKDGISGQGRKRGESQQRGDRELVEERDDAEHRPNSDASKQPTADY